MNEIIVEDFWGLSLGQMLEKLGTGVKPAPKDRWSLVAAAARFARSLWLSF